ncbi:MAG: MurR/RpiR family transcriptional regulator [Bauldia sp.]|nr:MurR/RpiR family transcriptional regulator [Bauldia sp.]
MKKSARAKAASNTAGLAPPLDFDALRQSIARAQSALPRRLTQAAEYALAHPDEIALGTAASIASAAEVQPSTLVRLAHQLGFGGFSEFQSVFRDRLRLRAATYDERLRRIEQGTTDGSYEDALLNGFLTAARQSIERLSETIDVAAFARCVGVLAKAETIYLVARRRAYPMAAHMSYSFGKLSIRAVTLDSANGIDQEIVTMATAKDAAIVCSFAPYAPASLAQAQSLSERHVPLVVLTDSALSPLAAMATHWLEVSESDFAGFRSLSAGMALATALPVAVAERRRFSFPAAGPAAHGQKIPATRGIA